MPTYLSNVPASFAPDGAAAAIVNAARDESVAADVCTVYQTSNASLNFPTIGSDLVAVDVPEGQQITLSEIGTGTVKVVPSKLVAGTRVSNEAMSDLLGENGDALSLFTGSLTAALAAKLDVNLVATLTATAGAVDGGSTAVDSLDPWHEAIASIRDAGAVPSAFLVSPATALRLSTMKESGSAEARRSLLQADPANPAVLQIAGIPFMVSRAVGDDVAYAVAKDRLAMVIRSLAEIVLDRSVYALSRETLVLAEVRAGYGVLQPESVVRLAVSPAA